MDDFMYFSNLFTVMADASIRKTVLDEPFLKNRLQL